MSAMEPICAEVQDLNNRIFMERLRLGEVLNRAHVNRSTWMRWTRGAAPKVTTLARVRAAIEAKVAERDQKETTNAQAR